MPNKVSDVQEIGQRVNQAITFVGGVKLTFRGVDPSKTQQGILTHLHLDDGRTIYINPTNVLAIEITIVENSPNKNNIGG